MLFLFSKDKMISCGIAICTVCILFFTASLFTDKETVATSSSSSKLLPVYSVDTQEKKVSLTINCAWNADDIEMILEILNKENVKLTFFMVGDWIEKYRRCSKKNI